MAQKRTNKASTREKGSRKVASATTKRASQKSATSTRAKSKSAAAKPKSAPSKAVKKSGGSKPVLAKSKAAAAKPKSAAPKAGAVKSRAAKTGAAEIKAAKPSASKAGAAKSKTKATAKPTKAAKKSKSGVNRAHKLSHIEAPVLKQIITKLEEMRLESQDVVHAYVQHDLQAREDSKDVGDDLDKASDEREREFSLLMHQRHLRRLQQVDDAFEKIEDGTYGLCEGTEEPINPKRLLSMPLARYSVEYQQEQEKILGRSPDQTFGVAQEEFASDD